MKRSLWPATWTLVAGALLATVGVRAQRTLALRESLTTAVPASWQDYASRDVTLSDDEIRVAGVTNYLSRVFQRPDTTGNKPPFFLYVGYYDRQTSGRTIHSPKNCLPGAGWEPLTSTVEVVETPAGPITVNRYLIQKGREQALVLYWYQGRGRVEHNEYLVKWDLLRDAALRRRSEEALVRIVVPVRSGEAESLRLAEEAAATIVPALFRAFPA